MSETVIKVENLSKQYRIGAREGYRTFRETLVDAAKAPFVRLSGALSKGLRAKSSPGSLPSAVGGRPSPDNIIWALKDVSFEVKQGEVVGIIGRNGAGKSTLLKILSRITEPTEGRVELRGRVGSLLEVGTGFHPELTGHENIYLYGAILGMDRWEITRKFDEIVAFAELEKFIDTPVKKYSSGMYMRLAFAVAAHLEPEILLVDEVLAVGDAAFQKKCLGKMGDVSKAGRTILFVSHNMSAVRALCNRGLFLHQSRISADDKIAKVISLYTGFDASNVTQYFAKGDSEKPSFRAITMRPAVKAGNFAIDMGIQIEFDIETLGRKNLVVGMVILNNQNMVIHHSSDELVRLNSGRDPSKRWCEIPPYALGPGKYSVDVFLAQRDYAMFQELRSVLIFEVEFAGPLAKVTSADQWKGICGPGLLLWT
jgi:lipopolysaccharide transport system ATP-binding protein